MLKACEKRVVNRSFPLKRATGFWMPARAFSLAAAFLAILMLSFGCSKSAPAPKGLARPLPPGPDQIFVNARFVVTENGNTSAIISADSVLVFQQVRPRSVAEGRLQVILFNPEGVKTSTLTADRGIVYGMTQAIDSLRAEGNVVIVWHERNARMNTPFIRWISSTRRIFADSTVALTVDNAVERGMGLEAPDDLKSYTMRQVTGSVVGEEFKIPERDDKADSSKAAR